jgi:hypothetical protein
MKSLPENPSGRQSVRSPSQVDREINEAAARLAYQQPGSRVVDFVVGLYRDAYGQVYQHHLDALATIERMKPYYYPMLDNAADELPELPDAAYYDATDDDRLEDLGRDLMAEARENMRVAS